MTKENKNTNMKTLKIAGMEVSKDKQLEIIREAILGDVGKYEMEDLLKLFGDEKRYSVDDLRSIADVFDESFIAEDEKNKAAEKSIKKIVE